MPQVGAVLHGNPSPRIERSQEHNTPASPSVTDPFSSSLAASSHAEPDQTQTYPFASLPPVLPLPRPLSPIFFEWYDYCQDTGSKRRRNARALSPPEAPPRKGPLRTGLAPLTDSQPVPPLPVSWRKSPQVEIGQVPTPDRGGSTGDARNGIDTAGAGQHRSVILSHSKPVDSTSQAPFSSSDSPIQHTDPRTPALESELSQVQFHAAWSSCCH